MDTVPKAGSIITDIASFTPLGGFQGIKTSLRSQAEVVLVVGLVDSGKIHNSEECVARNGWALSHLTTRVPEEAPQKLVLRRRILLRRATNDDL